MPPNKKKKRTQKADEPQEGKPREEHHPPPDVQLASVLASKINIKHILIDDAHARRATEAYTEKDVTRAWVEVQEVQFSRAEDQNLLNIALRIGVKVAMKDAENFDNPLVDIMARFVLVYELKDIEGIADVHLMAFARTSGMFSMWPYFREFVHSMSLHLSVPSIILPTYRYGQTEAKSQP